MCQTHCASSRAMWIALWMMKPALLAAVAALRHRLAVGVDFDEEDAVTSSKRRP